MRTRSAVLVLLLAVALRVLFFTGYQGRDDRTYIAYAQYINSGHALSSLDVQTQWVGRVGFWMPLAASMKAFGNTQVGYAAYSFICSLLGVLLVFRLGSITVGHRAALLAAILLAVMPLDVFYATRAYPDLPVGFLMTVAFWLALESREHPSLLWPIGAGLALGIGYLNKETALFAFVPIGVVLAARSPRYVRQLVVIGAAFALVVGAELSFWKAVNGDPFYRFHSSDAALERVLDRQDDSVPTVMRLIPGPRPDEIYRNANSAVDAALMLTTNEEFALFYWLAVPVLCLLWWKADGPTRELRVWSVLLLLFFLFFPVHWPRYTLPRDPRYFTCITIPVLLILAAHLQRVKPVFRSVAVASLIGTALIALFAGRAMSGMEPQERVAERYLASRETFWMTPQLAADVLILSGGRDSTHLGVHLLEQGRGSASFQATQLIDPAVAVAEGAADLRGGVLVLRERTRDRLPEGWTRQGRVVVPPSPPIAMAQSALRTVGLGRYATKLAPAGGESFMLYRCEVACVH